MFVELFLGVIAAILFALLWWNEQLAKYKCLNRFPGPTPIPFFGNILEFRKLDEILYTLIKLNDTYGPIFNFWQGTTPVLIITDREMTEFFLRSPKYITKSDMYDFLEPWLGTGMLASDGSTWQRKRKTITPAFHFKVLDNYISMFDDSCDTLVDILSTKADEDKCDIVPLITSFTLDIIAETAMGAQINAQREPKNEYVRAVHFMGSLVVKRATSLWKKFDFLFQFSNDYREQQKVCKILNDLTIKMIQERRQQLLQYREDDMDGEKKTLFLDILLSARIDGEPLSDIEIRDEVNSFMFGGHDTTASALSLILYALSNNLEVQSKIVEELKVIFGQDKNRPSTIQDTYEMKYMECVIKEMLRYYSPVPIIGRKLNDDVEYKETILPKGLNLIFFIYGMHNDPARYHKPNEFNPDRFISENTLKPYSFIPFSAGPRNCLGQKYALYEIKVTIAKLLRHFEFLPAGPGSELKLSPELVMKSLSGVHVRIKSRDY